MILFFLLLTLIAICFLRKKNNNETVLDKSSTTAIKGILCLYILLHNLGLDYQGNSPASLLICDHSGTVAVSAFFFLSGFGVLMGYKRSGNQFLKKLILKNAIKLYIISVLINLLIYLCFFAGQLNTTDLLLKLFNLDVFNDFNRMNRHGWFIPTIIGMYCIFALVMYIFSKTKIKNKVLIAILLVTIITIIFRANTYIFDDGGMYTKGLPCFGLGLIYCYYKDYIDKYANKFFWWIILLSLIICSISFVFFWGTTAGYLINLIIVTIATRYKYYNKCILFVGKISLGIYLFLYFSTLVWQQFVYNQYLWVLFNTVFTVLLAVLLYYATILVEKFMHYIKIKHLKSSTNDK